MKKKKTKKKNEKEKPRAAFICFNGTDKNKDKYRHAKILMANFRIPSHQKQIPSFQRDAIVFQEMPSHSKKYRHVNIPPTSFIKTRSL